jgi:hypothetical protein
MLPSVEGVMVDDHTLIFPRVIIYHNTLYWRQYVSNNARQWYNDDDYYIITWVILGYSGGLITTNKPLLLLLSKVEIIKNIILHKNKDMSNLRDHI